MEFVFDCPSEYYELDSFSIRSKLNMVNVDVWFATPHEPPSDPDLSYFVENAQKDQPENENSVNNEQYIPPVKRKRVSSGKLESGKISKDSHKHLNQHVPCKKEVLMEYSIDSNKSFNAKSSFSKASRIAGVDGSVLTLKRNQRKLTKGTNPLSKCPKSDEANSAKELEKSLEAMLREHNSRFAPTPTYIPPKHSVRDVRKWEKLSGKAWCDLKPEEREKVNEEIEHLKATNAL
jgi:hypothetical protein